MWAGRVQKRHQVKERVLLTGPPTPWRQDTCVQYFPPYFLCKWVSFNICWMDAWMSEWILNNHVILWDFTLPQQGEVPILLLSSSSLTQQMPKTHHIWGICYLIWILMSALETTMSTILLSLETVSISSQDCRERSAEGFLPIWSPCVPRQLPWLARGRQRVC